MKIGTTRVETFSDGVMAIIITIMVLSFEVPDLTKGGTALSVKHSLAEMLPYFITYTFSFMMIGIFWINHHHMFHLLEKTDERLLVQNLFFLFSISLVPLATAFVGGAPLVAESVAFYGFVMLLTTFAFSIMRRYSIRKQLIHKDKDKAIAHRIYAVSFKGRTKSYIGTLAYFVSVPGAFLSVYISFACFIIVPILFLSLTVLTMRRWPRKFRIKM